MIKNIAFKKRLYLLCMTGCSTILLISAISYALLDFYVYGNIFIQEGSLLKHILNFIKLSALTALPILLIGHMLASHLVKKVYLPIADLIKTSNNVLQTKDFSLRAEKFNNDEIGLFTDTFNLMVSEVQRLEEINKKSLDKAQQSSGHYLALFKQAEIVNRDLEKEAQERKQAELRLQRTRVHLNDIINSMPSALICIDENGIITEWNNAAEKFMDIPQSKALGSSANDVFSKFELLSGLAKETLEEKQTKMIEKVSVCKDNHEGFYDILAYPLAIDEIPGVVIRIDNITTQVLMQDMMVQTEKMMSVGGLAAGMAHEINNPLGAIMQSTQNIIRRLDSNTPANQKTAQELGLDWDCLNKYLEQRKINKFLESILDGGERAATIIKNMLQFSRKSDHNLITSDFVKLADRVITLASNDYDLKKDYDFRKIKIIREYQADLPHAPCIPSEIEQVLLNLFRNAAQAMNEAKTVDQQLIIRLFSKLGKMHIEVEDNGPGMPLEVQKKIFEPFYTTKEVGVGTGLGLSVSYFIIKDKHSGELTVRSKEGVGTCFDMVLPLEAYQEKSA
jgi:PAS domain S-box-containing protein